MRRLSIGLMCVATVFASQACWAHTRHGERFDLAKAETTLEQFQQDRDACIVKAHDAYFKRSSLVNRKHTCQNNPNPLPYPGMGTVPYDYDGHFGIHPKDSFQYYQGSQSSPSGPDYGRADGLFLKCMREKGYTRVPESTGFRAGPIWR